MARHSITGIRIQSTDMAQPLALGGLGSTSHSLGLAFAGPESGRPTPEFQFVATRAETFRFGCYAVNSLLGVIPFQGGRCVDSDAQEKGLELIAELHSQCGTLGRSAGSTHRMVTAGKAHLFIDELSWQPGGHVMASVNGVLLSTDGLAKPSTTVYNAPLPSGLITDEYYTLSGFDDGGGVLEIQVGGTVIPLEELTSLTLASGNEFTPLLGANRFPTSVDVTKVRSRLTIGLANSDLLADAKIPENGKQCTLNDTFFAFRKVAANTTGDYVATGTAEHIRVQVAGLATIGEPLSADGGATSSCTLEVVATGLPSLAITRAISLDGET